MAKPAVVHVKSIAGITPQQRRLVLEEACRAVCALCRCDLRPYEASFEEKACGWRYIHKIERAGYPIARLVCDAGRIRDLMKHPPELAHIS